jgi:hypothetical protein
MGIVLGLATGGMLISSCGLAIGGMPISSVGFGYRWDACERWSVLAIGVTSVSLRTLITISNLGAWSCLVVV